MSIATRIQSIEEHLENAYDKIDDLGIDIAEVDKNIDNIAEMLEDVWNEYPKVPGTGTEVTLEGTKVGKMGIDIKGNSTQETTTGKQLFDNAIIKKNVVNYDLIEDTTTPTGKRIKYIGNNTLTSTIAVIYAVMDLTNHVGKTVRFKSNFTASASNRGRYYIGLCNSDGSNRSAKDTTNTSGNIVSFVVPELSGSQTYLCLGLYVNTEAGTVNKNDYIDFKDMIITIDNNDMTYEPYTGGLPSPNPSYPQPIHSAGEGAVGLPIEYTQLDYIESSETQYIDTGFKPNQDTAVELDYNYVDDGVFRHDWSAFGVNDLFNFTASNISPLRVKYNGVIFNSTHSTLNRFKVKLDKNKVYVDGILENTFTSATFSCTQNALLFARRNNANGALQERSKMRLYNCKLWDNGTLIRNFIPCYRNSDKEAGLYDLVNNVFYTNQGTGNFIKGNVVGITEKIVNKNLADISDSVLGYAVTNIGSKITFNSSTVTRSYKKVCYVEAGKTYCMSKNPNTPANASIRTSAICDKNEIILETIQFGTTNTNNSFTPSNTGYLYLVMDVNATDIQVEQGSTATTYVAHAEQTFIIPVQQPMRKIGTVKDCFFKNTTDNPLYDSNLTLNAWYERHEIKRRIFDGTETWYRYSYGTTRTVMEVININDIETYSSATETPQMLSNYFISISQSATWKMGDMSRRTQELTHLYLTMGPNYTIETFQAWLAEKYTSGNPVYVDYLLATPTDLPCTSEQTTALEALSKAKGYDNVVHVFSTDGTPAFVKVEAMKGA